MANSSKNLELPFEFDKLPFLDLEEKDKLPQHAAVYLAVDVGGKILYVGHSKNLHSRWRSHNRLKQLQEHGNVQIYWVTVTNELLLPEIEKALIEHFQPEFNRDGQSAYGMKRLTLDIPESLHREIKMRAASQGVAMADMLREILENHFRE